jgi:hypothetical protein
MSTLPESLDLGVFGMSSTCVPAGRPFAGAGSQRSAISRFGSKPATCPLLLIEPATGISGMALQPAARPYAGEGSHSPPSPVICPRSLMSKTVAVPPVEGFPRSFSPAARPYAGAGSHSAACWSDGCQSGLSSVRQPVYPETCPCSLIPVGMNWPRLVT